MIDMELDLDEMRIVQMYSGISRKDTIRRAMMASAYVDTDCIELMARVIAKLTLMTDEALERLGTKTAFDPYEYLEEDG